MKEATFNLVNLMFLIWLNVGAFFGNNNNNILNPTHVPCTQQYSTNGLFGPSGQQK